MTQYKDYLKAESLAQALKHLSENEQAAVIAGGTDLLLKKIPDQASEKVLIDISGLKELSTISLTTAGLSIGAAATLSAIETSALTTGPLGVIREAASLIGSPQIRNQATIGGNLCNASPSADMSAPLLAANASVEIASAASRREVSLAEFFVGPSKTILEKGELLTAVHIPNPPQKSGAVYKKHSYREAMDLALVGVCVFLWQDNGKLENRLAISAVAPTPIRVYAVEKLITGEAELTEELIEKTASLAVKAASPISDVRASKEYRQAMVCELVKRALLESYEKLMALQEI